MFQFSRGKVKFSKLNFQRKFPLNLALVGPFSTAFRFVKSNKSYYKHTIHMY